jgi:hypothetical protein
MHGVFTNGNPPDFHTLRIGFEFLQLRNFIPMITGNKAYSLMREEPQALFKAKVKAGRFPNTFELLGIEKA